MRVDNHTGQVVTDIERSKRFYQEVLGFQLWYDLALPDEGTAKLLTLEPPLRAVASYLFLDGFVLDLIQFSAEGARAPYRQRVLNEPGLTHLSVSVDDIRASAKRAVAYGGQVVEQSHVGVALFIRHPDGQFVELLSKAYPESRPPRP